MQANKSDQSQIGRMIRHSGLGMAVRQAILFDANTFCPHISQLAQLTSGNILYPERFDQVIHIEQGKESLKQFFLILREDSLQQNV